MKSIRITLFAALLLLVLAACGDTTDPAATLDKSVVASGSGELEIAVDKGSRLTNLRGATGSSKTYRLKLPRGANNLRVTTSGGRGDVDLFVRKGSAPSGRNYDCGSTSGSNRESCTFSSASNTTFYINLTGYRAFSGVTLRWVWDDGSGNPAPAPAPAPPTGPLVPPCDLTSGLPC